MDHRTNNFLNKLAEALDPSTSHRGRGNRGGFGGDFRGNHRGSSSRGAYNNRGGYDNRGSYDNRGDYDNRFGYDNRGSYDNRGGHNNRGGFANRSGIHARGGYSNRGGHNGRGGFNNQAEFQPGPSTKRTYEGRPRANTMPTLPMAQPSSRSKQAASDHTGKNSADPKKSEKKVKKSNPTTNKQGANPAAPPAKKQKKAPLLALVLVGGLEYHNITKENRHELIAKCNSSCKDYEIVGAYFDPSKNGWGAKIKENILESDAQKIIVVYLCSDKLFSTDNVSTLIDECRDSFKDRIDMEIGFNVIPNTTTLKALMEKENNSEEALMGDGVFGAFRKRRIAAFEAFDKHLIDCYF